MERKKRVVPREVSSADENRVLNPSVTTNGEKSAEAIVPRKKAREGLNNHKSQVNG